ncbi:MAG: winged helix-turn-helix transcriptional regulator [Bryobacteraceae bacterium]|nr:winged helix-turn-helix transcriptional regulator [Bryobacteraceae bacterium]
MPRQSNRIQTAPDTSGLHLWLVLWKCWTAVHNFALDDIASGGLGFSDFAILEVLLHKGPLPVNAIGTKIGLTSGSMTVAVDRLASRDLVKREDDVVDRRTRIVALTDPGRALVEEAFAKHRDAMNALGEVLPEGERKSAIRILKKLGKAAEAELRPTKGAVQRPNQNGL